MHFRATLAWDAIQFEAPSIDEARSYVDVQLTDGHFASGVDSTCASIARVNG